MTDIDWGRVWFLVACTLGTLYCILAPSLGLPT